MIKKEFTGIQQCEKQFLVFCFGQHFLERNGFQFVSPVHETEKTQFTDHIVRRFAFLESPSDQVSILNLSLPGISIEQVQACDRFGSISRLVRSNPKIIGITMEGIR